MRFWCRLLTYEALAQSNRMRKREVQALYLSAGYSDINMVNRVRVMLFRILFPPMQYRTYYCKQYSDSACDWYS